MQIVFNMNEIVDLLNKHTKEKYNLNTRVVDTFIDDEIVLEVIPNTTPDNEVHYQDKESEALEEEDTSEEDNEFEELKKEADSLGIKYRSNITYDTLKDRVNDFFEQQIQKEVEEEEKEEEESSNEQSDKSSSINNSDTTEENPKPKKSIFSKD